MVRIVIIGAGPAGLNAAQALARALRPSDETEVTVLEKSKFFYHTIGAPRAYTEGAYAAKMFIPYDNAIPKGAAAFVRILRGVATSISAEKNEVRYRAIGDDDRPRDEEAILDFDYLIIATGSTYAVPIKQDGANYSRSHTEAQLQEVRAQIAKADKILIVGGGAVGCEVAGDIATHFPAKSVTLLEGKDKLIGGNTMTNKFLTRVAQALERLRVQIILDETLEEGLTENCFERRTLRTNKGREIESDIQLLCAGFSPVGLLVKEMDASLVDERGSVRVNAYLQLDNEKYHHMFALGDVSNHSTPKLAFWAGEQAKYLTKELVAIIRRKQANITRAFPNVSVEAMILPLGPRGGVSQLPVFRGLVVGNFLTRKIKAKDMLARRMWGSLNATTPTA
ncbi:hypothetical protein Poli38472_004286 [Pythium oligandrum]|uniref:FAD/NAD(P)-binding domain-containing protein n=1 Tax=Pythium oligandrum TaxID=41045 RepID=A0A8K1CPU7_PYTOL|nr:hypothetical protein Poli38472_004286 [Pythium oligandrum]|eukprot:TMW66521.1 hypothetical protein Poli38472_004286 [Pythium oligandrum]